ncbi:MAG: hypothetical protein ACFFG0_40485 [Candidatus Thorarchaeota archaeon]
MSENAIEIKETLRKSYYTSVCCLIFGISLLIIIAFFITNIAETQEVNFLNVIGTIILLVFGFIMIVLLIYIGFKMRGGRQVRSFLIDQNAITFKVPNKPSFTVKLESFDTLEVSRLKKDDFLDFFTSTSTTYYKFHFLEVGKSFTVQSQKDYSRRKLNEIRATLEHFCRTHGKAYIFKK